MLQETARLHGGDPTNVELWQQFLPACLAEIEVIYKRLGVTFDHTLGESFYHDRLRGVVKDLADKGLAAKATARSACSSRLRRADDRAEEGRRVSLRHDRPGDDPVSHERVAAGRDSVRRRSSAVAALRAAVRRGPAVGLPRRRAAAHRVRHRAGRRRPAVQDALRHSVGLAGLLDEAVERAYAIVSQNDDARPEPLLSEDERRQVAERIGIGAIKYADLAHNRTSDYVFSYDKMLAMTGNTATYMQYSYARVTKHFRQGRRRRQSSYRERSSADDSR